jgi:hypothetical protein
VENALAGIVANVGYQKLCYDLNNGIDPYDSIAAISRISRSEGKSLFFKEIFGWPKKANSSPLELLYPEMMSSINELKKFRLKINPKPEYHKNLALILQRMESKWILDKVIKGMIAVGIDFALTIHDSVIVKEEDLNLTKQVLHQIADEIFDFRPKLKITTLSTTQTPIRASLVT